MKYNIKKIGMCLIAVFTIFLITNCTFAHSGRTDSSGGHKDNQNKSGLGGYHYHCGGHPAHLHTNGVCPYSTSSSSSSKSSSTSSSSSSSKSKSSTTNTTTKISSVAVTGIEINENIQNMEIGDTKTVTATITPNNATDKNITWKSSDESIATVSSSGEIDAIKEGSVTITASSSNGKTSTLTINIKEEPKIENGTTTSESNTSEDNVYSNIGDNNTTTYSQEDANPLVGFVTLGALGGGGYWGYSKFKKRK